MENLTKNEARVIDFLLRHFDERHSINALGRHLDLSPRGIYTILKRLEQQGIVTPERIGNATYYHLALENELCRKLGEFVLLRTELGGYARVQAKDLLPLKEHTEACVLFGSVLTKGREARDVDVLLVLEKEQLKEAQDSLAHVREIQPKHLHDILFTKRDLVKNLRNRDEVMLNILKIGAVLWGSGIIVEAIRNGRAGP